MAGNIGMLRRARGTQNVTFAEVADHLFDYVERHPDEALTVERLAEFLAVVEGIPHDHNADPERGLPAPGAVPTQVFG